MDYLYAGRKQKYNLNQRHRHPDKRFRYMAIEKAIDSVIFKLSNNFLESGEVHEWECKRSLLHAAAWASLHP